MRVKVLDGGVKVVLTDSTTYEGDIVGISSSLPPNPHLVFGLKAVGADGHKSLVRSVLIENEAQAEHFVIGYSATLSAQFLGACT